MNVTLTHLPPGDAELHYAAKVEPYRNGLLPRPAALATVAVAEDGEATFDLTPRIEYAVFAADGKARNVMYSTTRGGTP